MSKKFKEYKKLDLPAIADEVLATWKREHTFEKSVTNREGANNFVFYEGPPSANGLPGIHHVMARSIKDIFCRYKTLKGFQVKRKAGWDTHGLPIELGVEKSLGITKEDIGKKISIEDYNNACRKDVMKYTGIWNDLTEKMGYWVDMENPYVTYENSYIESVWNLLSKIFEKGMLYKGYTIQPYSPAAGTGLSSHEINQPGCYRNIKDTTVVAQFKAIRNQNSEFLFEKSESAPYLIAWTTTPWTLPSNTALAVGSNIDYVLVKTFNQYTFEPIYVILAKNLLGKHFPEKNSELELKDYKPGDKNIPYKIIDQFKGSALEGIRYEQLMPYAQPADGDSFRIIIGDFVTTEDGTGIVHIAPSFGSDDFRVAAKNKIGSLTLVDTQGKFKPEVTDYAGEYVKEQYIEPEKFTTEYKPVDVKIAIKLKEENKAFKVEKYEHSYPHCWRTDKPILYYPLDSWFIKTTAVKDRLIELNKTINWKPSSTGTGRFGNWLENLMDWNLSRSRYWGIPIPIWTTEGKSEQICIGSAEQLKTEIDKSIAAGFMVNNPLKDFKPGDFSKENYTKFDLHRPYVDDIILVSASGIKMHRETDLIDVWFDSGAMPYAQLHYPFENKDSLPDNFPADFIAEGVDQTRGWFFTLHAISTMVFDSVAFKNVISNGLVLDKNGQKMSKRLGNAADPFETLSKYGADATRWYMITNSQPWDNLKFDVEGIIEVQRKFFGTLYNTYNFFALYANIDGFNYKEDEIPIKDRPEIDRWILSVLNTLIKEVDQALDDYESTKAGRAIQEFVDEHLSNWYVRLCRRRFWKGEYTEDKIAAYQTLYTCLEVVAKLGSVIAPFFMDKLFSDLNQITKREKADSVHLGDFPVCNSSIIDKELEERMEIAQKISSMVLSLRKKQNIRVRQPLGRIMVPISDSHFKTLLEKVKDLILSEVNVKQMEFLTDTQGVLSKKIKPNFKSIGPKYGKQMKAIAQAVAEFDQNDISLIEKNRSYKFDLNGETISLDYADFEIISEDIPGWLVASDGKLTVALDININQQLKEEGLAREIINRIQNLRKEKGLEVTDKIGLKIKAEKSINSAINNNLNYICTETLASTLEIVNELDPTTSQEVEVDEEVKTLISIIKLN
ncbi:MAG: isoleucine--tRNA ligase [Bacteroidetes bacterium]|nr:isoleucine--tRNA ligase [Bacteroidota bacterium]HET6244715.1 isoleucine--tRNA ligase [Bacteroidia bacterium]